MINICGILGAWLFVFKISWHIYLLIKINKTLARETIYSHNSLKHAGLFLPFREDVPKKFQWLKVFINVVYFLSIAFIIVFLIGLNFYK